MEAKPLPRNVPGRFYTTEDCDGCAFCASVAPDLFDYEKSSNTYYVAKQPTTREEEEFLLEALDDCPVDAIQMRENGNGKGRPHSATGR